MNNNQEKKKTARLAGSLYLLMGITGVFSMIYVPMVLFVPDDGLATAQNISGSTTLFTLGILSNLVSQIVFIVLVFTFFNLLKVVNKTQAMIMVGIVLVGVSITCLNMLNQYAMLIPLTNNYLQQVFSIQQRHALIMTFHDLYAHGIHISEIFWGLWLLPLGLLIIQSKFIPKVVGIFLLIACIGYLLSSLSHLMLPNLSGIISPLVSTLSTVGEFTLIGWLLIKGVRSTQTLGVQH